MEIFANFQNFLRIAQQFSNLTQKNYHLIPLIWDVNIWQMHDYNYNGRGNFQRCWTIILEVIFEKKKTKTYLLAKRLV